MFLLNGFKKYHSAKKLNIGIMHYRSFGSNEALVINKLMRISNSKSLNMLKQTKPVNELKKVHEIINGDFSVYSFMYNPRPVHTYELHAKKGVDHNLGQKLDIQKNTEINSLNKQ